MSKNTYAVFTMKDEVNITKKNLERFDLDVVSIEETTPLYAWCLFGIYPTSEVLKKLPDTLTVFVEGTENEFKKYCTEPANDVGEYWSKGA